MVGVDTDSLRTDDLLHGNDKQLILLIGFEYSTKLKYPNKST